jgi:uncharacterized protein
MGQPLAGKRLQINPLDASAKATLNKTQAARLIGELLPMTVKHILALALLCVGSQGMARSLVRPLDTIPVTAVAESVDVDPALWVVKDKDTTIYLFGTIHILRPGMRWFDDAVKAAFDRSGELVVEMVEPSAAESQVIFAKYGIDTSGKALSAKLSDADRIAYKKLLEKIELPFANFEPLDPWAVAVTLQLASLSSAGFDPESGVDSQLESAAKAAKKPISGVETFEFQLAMFDGLPPDSQIKFLSDSISGFDEMGKGMDQLVAAWAKPDPEALAGLMNDGLTDPVLYSRLLAERNANWAKWIHGRMEKPGVVFMAVGAGHLAGKDSVQKLLKQYRRKAKRIKY